MKSKSTLALIASIILVFIGFCGVVSGVSAGKIPLWSTTALIVGGIIFFLWIVLLTSESVSKAKKLQREQLDERIQLRNQAKREANDLYYKLCSKVANTLQNANKPTYCNKVRFADSPFIFPELKSYQYYTEWEIWRDNDFIYLYNAQVENFPEDCSIGEAPVIGCITANDIQYFSMDGHITTETVVSGGVVKQDKKTGKVSQSALKSRTVERDKRVVKLSVLENGIVKKLEFTKEAYDVFLALIPEKEKIIKNT